MILGVSSLPGCLTFLKYPGCKVRKMTKRVWVIFYNNFFIFQYFLKIIFLSGRHILPPYHTKRILDCINHSRNGSNFSEKNFELFQTTQNGKFWEMGPSPGLGYGRPDSKCVFNSSWTTKKDRLSTITNFKNTNSRYSLNISVIAT